WVTPRRQCGIAVRAQMAYETLQRLEKRRVGNVALQLVVLAGNEHAALLCDGRIQLLDQSGFANAGIAGDEQQFTPTGADAVKSPMQCDNFLCATIQFLRQGEAANPLMASQREGSNPPASLPLPQARGQIALQPACRLIPVGGILG